MDEDGNRDVRQSRTGDVGTGKVTKCTVTVTILIKEYKDTVQRCKFYVRVGYFEEGYEIEQTRNVVGIPRPRRYT